MTIDSLRQLLDWEPPYRPDAIIEDNLLLPETAMLMFGSAKSWKTIHSMHLAFCLATGSPWFGYETRKVSVLKIQVELPKYQDKVRIQKYSTFNVKTYTPNIFFHTPEDSLLLDTTYGAQQLARLIDETKKRLPVPNDHLVVILDPVYHLMKGSVSSEEDVKTFQLRLNEIRKKFQVTFIIVHHARLIKTDSSGSTVDLGAEEIMGSSLWNNWCDTMIRFQTTNPFAGANITKVTFPIPPRNAQRFHPPFSVKWNRADLSPTVIQRDIVEDTDTGENSAPSVRDLVG